MERAKTVFRVIKEYIIKYYVAFFCGGVVWMLLDVYVTKGIDASFVSAIMDTIMAGTAMLAVLAAKNYLAQFTAQEGFKIAISLVNDVMLDIPKHEDVVQSYSELHDKIYDANGKRLYYYTAEEISVLNRTLRLNYSRLNTIHQNMLEEKSKLATYGIDVNKKRLDCFEKIMLGMKVLITECKNLASNSDKIESYIRSNHFYAMEPDVIVALDLSKLNLAKPILDKSEIDIFWQSVVANYTEFKKDGSSITELFKVYG